MVLSQYVEVSYADDLLASGGGGVGYLLLSRVTERAIAEPDQDERAEKRAMARSLVSAFRFKGGAAGPGRAAALVVLAQDGSSGDQREPSPDLRSAGPPAH